MVESDHYLEQEVCVTCTYMCTGCTLIQMHVMDWAEAQREDPVLSALLDWLEAQKGTDFKALLEKQASSEEGQMILWNQQNFVAHWGVLYLCSMPKGETKNLLLFVVLKAHCIATLNGCDRDASHQGCDCTLSLLREHFGSPEWLIKCGNLSRTVCIVCNTRANYPKCLYIQLLSPLHWTSYMLIFPALR